MLCSPGFAGEPDPAAPIEGRTPAPAAGEAPAQATAPAEDASAAPPTPPRDTTSAPAVEPPPSAATTPALAESVQESPNTPIEKAPAPPAEAKPSAPPAEAKPTAKAPAAPAPTPVASALTQDEMLVATPFALGYLKARPGMTYDEVRNLVGEDTLLVAGTMTGGNKIVRWEGANGMSFAARFTDGRLDRVTRLHLPAETAEFEQMAKELEQPAATTPEGPAKPQEPQTGAPAAEAGVPQAAAEAAEGAAPTPDTQAGTAPAEKAAGSGTMARAAEEAPEEEASAEGPGAESAETAKAAEEPAAAPSKVVRVQHKIESAGTRSYRRAKLPDYSARMERGPHDVSIYNPYPNAVEVGVRSGGRGKNFRIPAYGSATLYLKTGSYSVYFVDSEDPESLKSAGGFTIDSPPGLIEVDLY